jgi:hypothetical protein
MNYMGSFYAFLTAIGFKTNLLTQRLLQEKGASQIDTYTIYRYAVVPSAIWCLIFVRKPDIVFVLHSPKLLIYFGVIIVLWNLQALLMSLVINSTNSMTLFTTIFNMMLLPLFLAFGTFFNHDKPNLFSIVSIVILLVALVIKPTPHKKNLRLSFSKPLYIILLLVFAKACCDTVLQGVGRAALQEIHPVVFLGLFSLPTLTVCAIISQFYIRPRTKKVTNEAAVMKDKQWIAILLMPITWFAASIPEAFALAAIPIYTFISINVITFGMDTTSDVLHKRIRLSTRTVSFLVLVVAGISLSVLSV